MLISLLVICIEIWLIYTYVLPSLPDPIKGIFAIVVAVVIIVVLLGLAGVH